MATSTNSTELDRASFFSRSRVVLTVIVVALFLLGLGLRLLDLTDQPLDFHPDRQLHSAIVARGMYYEMSPSVDPAKRSQAVALWQGEGVYEPTIVESLVAFAYLLTGGEHLVIPRLFSILYWLIGGLALYALARRLVSADGAVFSLGFYMVLPFGVTASRSFMPDPFMVMWIILAVLCLVRWEESRSWKWAIMSGIAAGMGALIKPWAGLILGTTAIALVLTGWGLKKAVRTPQIWATALLMVAIPGIYYGFIFKGSASGYFAYWTLGFSHLLVDPGFYIRWIGFLRSMIDFSLLVAALVGVSLLAKRGRAVGLGLWAGYFLFGMVMPYGIYTHDYYNLPLVPIVALCLAPVGSLILSKLAGVSRVWQWAAIGVLIFSLAYPAWVARSALFAKNYRFEPPTWQRICRQIPPGESIVALTQSNGIFLKYYCWLPVGNWPSQVDFDLSMARNGSSGYDFPQVFAEKTAGKDLFLVTVLFELDAQPQLKAALAQYPVVAQDGSFILYDIRNKK